MLPHGPRRRMGRYVHFSAPVRKGQMCVIVHFSEAPSDGRGSKEIRRTPSSSDRSHAELPERTPQNGSSTSENTPPAYSGEHVQGGRAGPGIRRATGKGEGAARKMDPPHRGTIAGVDESSVNFPGKLETFPIP